MVTFGFTQKQSLAACRNLFDQLGRLHLDRFGKLDAERLGALQLRHDVINAIVLESFVGDCGARDEQ